MTDVDAFKAQISSHMEISFEMDDGTYFISDAFTGGNGFMCVDAQDNEFFYKTPDDVLDNFAVMGKPMRDMMGTINLYG